MIRPAHLALPLALVALCALPHPAVAKVTAATHLAAAQAALQRGDAEAALAAYDRALALDPTQPAALEGAAALLAQLGHYREAIPFYGRLVAARPDDPRPRLAGATAMILAGEHARAKIVLEQAHQRWPDHLDVLDLLARHLAACPDPTVRDGARAVQLAEVLVAKVPTPESHETLAMAHAQAGNFPRALEVQKALLGPEGPEADEATQERWRANLALYEAGKACCAPSPN